MNTQVVSDDALKFMESNTINFIETKRLIESTNLREFYKFGMSYESLEQNFLIPPGNRTESVTGKLITVPNTARYFRFPTKMKIYDANESYGKVEPSVQSLKVRGLSKRRSIVVFVNGEKVPDEVVYVYTSPVGTDVFIPVQYFSTISPNDLVCVMKNYSDGYYSNYYNATANGNNVKNIPTTINTLSQEMVNVWVNGRYVPKNSFTISASSTKFNINFVNDYITQDSYRIEVSLDRHQIAKYSDKYIDENGKLTMYIPKNALALIETAVFVNMCDLYLDGRRLSPIEVEQKTYRHIQYKESVSADSEILSKLSTEIVVSDNNVEGEAFADYVNDFMEYEKWANDENIVKSIYDETPSGLINPDFVSMESLEFPPANAYKFDNSDMFELSNEQRAILMIQENRHYLKNLLKYWGVKEENYTVQRNGIVHSGEKVTINLDLDSSDDKNITTRNIELFVNEKKIPNGDLVYLNQWGTDNVQIPISKFSEGSDKTDKIRMYRSDVKNVMIPFLKFSSGTSVKGNGAVKITDILGVSGGIGEYNLNELRVFRQISDVESDTEHLFININGASVYYELLDNSSDEYILSEIYNSETGKNDLYITIPNDSSIKNNDILMVVNPKFHSQLTFNLVETGDYDSQFRVILNPVDGGEVIPVILDDYTVKVFVNGIIMVPDVDYSILTPDKYNRLTSSQILFRRIITTDDVIEVEMTGIKNKQYAGYRKIPLTNKYGFIFFDKLDIPFDLDYMDLYVNNKKLTKDDVVVYTDRLIRVKENISLPMTNIVLYTRLNRDITDFEPYIQQYQESTCSFDDYIRSFCKEEIFDQTSELPENDSDINDVFEDEYDDVEENKIPNPINPDYIDQLRFDTFMDRLARDFNRDKNLVTKIFNANIMKDFSPVEYAILIPETIRNSRTVPMNANENDEISEDFDLNPNRNYRTSMQIAKLIADIFHSSETLNDINANSNFNAIENPIISNYLYPEDIDDFDANKEFDDSRVDQDIIIDANEGN